MFKVSSLNAISVMIKIFTGLVTSKFLAVYVGPSGMALVGNFRNFMSSIDSVGTLGFQNGIVKLVVESDKKEERLQKIFSTLLFCVLIVSLVLGFVLFCFADYWNQEIFGKTFQFQLVFRLVAVVLPFYIGSLYLLSLINGFQRFREVIWINIIGNVMGVILTSFLVWKFATLGALIAIIMAPSFLFFISVFYLIKEVPLQGKFKIHYFDLSVCKELSHYFVMTMVSGVLGSIVYIAIRNAIISKLGLTEAGYWEAISRISTYYLLFVNTILSIYYYPKLVAANSNREIKEVIWSFYKGIVGYFAIALVVIFLLRELLVQLVFTSNFEPVSQLFFWQLVGDFLKTISWILGLVFFAKKMTKAFIITESLSLLIMYFSSLYGISYFSLQGVVIAHAFSYFLYLMVLIFYFRKTLLEK